MAYLRNVDQKWKTVNLKRLANKRMRKKWQLNIVRIEYFRKVKCLKNALKQGNKDALKNALKQGNNN